MNERLVKTEAIKERILNGDFLCNTYLAQYAPMEAPNDLCHL